MSTVMITEKFRVNIDVNVMNHTLEKLSEGGKNPKTGEPTDPRWVVEGHFPNMAQCLRRVIQLELASGMETRTLEKYAEQFKSMEEWSKTLTAGA